MFSGWVRSIILVSLGLAGLLLLCVPMSRAYADEQANPVLSVYMTNAGVHLTFGLSNSQSSLYELTINTWDHTDLYGDPPNLVFNNSPLKFFRTILREAAPHLLNEMMTRRQLMDPPLQVYISAAGADKAETLPVPDQSIASFLSDEQKSQCYVPELNRRDFYQCVFAFEVKTQLHRPSLSPKIQLIVEQDTHLINAMAWSHGKQLNKTRPGQPAIVIHTTTIGQPYLMKDGRAVPLAGWVPPAMAKKGGVFQIGQEFQSFLKVTESSSLVDVIQHDPRSHNHPLGQQAYFMRLKQGKGYNNFGRMVGETAMEINRETLGKNGLNTNSSAYQHALRIAAPMVVKARKAFIQLTLALYARNEFLFEGQYPHIIIVGEETDILFPSLSTYTSTAWEVIGETHPGSGDWQKSAIAKRADLSSQEAMQAWIENKAGNIVHNVSILPVSKFAKFQHQASIRLLDHSQP